jgi:DNA-binding XRE family transcriptional regulator
MIKPLGPTIKAYRKRKKLSQKEFAEKLGVSRQSVILWEKGSFNPRNNMKNKIHDVFPDFDQLQGDNSGIKKYEEERSMETRLIETDDYIITNADGMVVRIHKENTNIVEALIGLKWVTQEGSPL